METKLTAEKIERSLRLKIASLSAPLTINNWRFKIGAPEGAQAPAYDDSDWSIVKLHYSWSSMDGEAWFRTRVDMPQQVEGIDLHGPLELEIFLPIGAVIYVDGHEMYREASWTDTRGVRLLLLQDSEPGASVHLTIRCNAGDGNGTFLESFLHIASVDQAIFALDTLRAQLNFTNFLAERDGHADAGSDPATWARAAAALDLPALAANDWNRWAASTTAARDILAPFAEPAKSYTVNLVAHGHIDIDWLWPMQETIAVSRRDFTAMDALMGKYEEFHFSQSQAALYREMELGYPELFAAIRRRVAEGRWEITASTWAEGDNNLAAGEAIARHLLHTRRYIAAHFGVEPPICWEPDTFGHPASLPQVLKLAGVRYYYFCRAGQRQPLFWWEGVDGSRVLAVEDRRGYNGAVTPTDVTSSAVDFAAPNAIHRGLYVYGVGDHGGAATTRDIQAARLIDAEPYLPHARLSSASAFYEEALAEKSDLPVLKSELNTIFEGCYTTHGDIKRLNRNSENALLSAETSEALAALWTGDRENALGLAEAWRTVCLNQFHDILCGAGIGLTYRLAGRQLNEVLSAAAGVSERGLAALAGAIDTGLGAGARLVIFNTLAWPRSDVVQLPLAQLGGQTPAALIDETGRRVPVQVSGEYLCFVAEELPALGVRVYHYTDEPDAIDMAKAVVADADENVLDNGKLRLRVHPASGALDQLVDQESQRDLTGPRLGWGPEVPIRAGLLNRLQIAWEQPHPMSAWNIGDITHIENLITGAQVKVVENGPVFGAIEVRRNFLHSSLVQRIKLYRGLRRIDFETEVDWHERGSAHADAPMLRTSFTPYLADTRATFEIPYAGLERPADGREVPAQRWADLSECEANSPAGRMATTGGRPVPAYGLSLLNNCKYGHSAQGNTLGLTLLRASYEPDNNPDEGLHRFTYALYPHAGGWEEAGTVRHAAELNQPLLAAVDGGHDGSLKPGSAWLSCSPDDVVVSAVKLAEDQPAAGRAIIVRFYEAHGRPAEAVLRLAWPVASAEEVDLIERRLAPLEVVGGELRLALRPHEIKTMKLYTDLQEESTRG